MSYRNQFFDNRNRNNQNHMSYQHMSKYKNRVGSKFNRPEKNHRSFQDECSNLIGSTMKISIGNENMSYNVTSTPQKITRKQMRRLNRANLQPKAYQVNAGGWWRVTIQEAATIGKDRVMSSIKAYCARQFQPYHYYIDMKDKSGIFFVNNQQDADMIKRANGKIEVQSIDILRIFVGRVQTPVPFIDDELKAHLKDYLINRRYNSQTCQLDLSNLADDEELNGLGIYPQLNKNAFIRNVVELINKYLPMTRILDLGSNNINNLFEFNNLQLNNLVQISLASNQLKNLDDFVHLKQLAQLFHLIIKNNPLAIKATSMDDLISIIRQKLPKLKRIDDIDLPALIRLPTDVETVEIPKSNPYHVPDHLQSFLTQFIDTFYRLFDVNGRNELHMCYHDSCLFSLCISMPDDSIVPTRHKQFGALLEYSRNLRTCHDNIKRSTLLFRNKINILEFLKKQFPSTKHDGNSFRVDCILQTDNVVVFTINGLYKEINRSDNGPVRCFQRTFTCENTPAGIFIKADHMTITNPTDAQISKMTHATTAAPTENINQQSEPTISIPIKDQMVAQFAQQSGMNTAYSKLCLEGNDWNYNKAAQSFLVLKERNEIPFEAFQKH